MIVLHCFHALADYKPDTVSPTPTQQFRTDYIVLTPENYAEHYLNFIYPSGTTIDNAAQSLSMGFTKGGEPKKLSKGISCHLV